MKIRFLKYCVWSYGGGRIAKYHTGIVCDIIDGHASEMIRCGYAEEVPEDAKSESAEKVPEKTGFDEEKRRVFYKDFSKDELVSLCRENIGAYMPSVHRNIPDMIDLILLYEKDHGFLKENKEDE